MQLCAITDRRALGGSDQQQCSRLVELAGEWARGGIDYVQVREKDLGPVELERLVRRVVAATRLPQARSSQCEVPQSGARTKVLVNGSAAVAAAAADGLHLPGSFAGSAVEEARCTFGQRAAILSVACHSVADVERACELGADLILLAPIFGKRIDAKHIDAKHIDAKHIDSEASLPGIGLAALEAACRIAGEGAVFALGGVTAENAQSCIDAGAAGVAGISLFMGQDWRST